MNLKEMKSLIIAVAEGLKTTDVEVVEAMLINNIREAMQISVEPVEVEKVVEVEKIVEKEVPVEIIKEVEVIPADVQETLEDNESYINELEIELRAVLNDVEILKNRCTELHNQNEELIKALNEDEAEELEFEEPEEVSNEDILANNSDDEVDEEEVLKQMTESLDQLVEDDNEKK